MTTSWVQIKVAEDATPFREHFVAFKSDESFHRFIEVMTIPSNGENLKIGYINHLMHGWAVYPREEGYSMDFLVNRSRKDPTYAQASLINSELRTANLSFRFLDATELEQIYRFLFLTETAKVNGSIGGIYLTSIKEQLIEMKSETHLPQFLFFASKYLSEKLVVKYM